MTDIPTRSLTLFDPYSFRARLQPALIALFPLAVGMFAWTAGQWPWASALWGLFGTAGGTYLLAILARRSGRVIEPRLWESWGGAPTTQLLRHRGRANPFMRARWHKALGKLRGATLPTAEEENADPKAADLAYEDATKVAIGRTRDVRTYALLFKENTSYGFCRNLYALRRLGVFAALLGLALAAIAAWHASRTGAAQLIPWICFALNLGTLLVWLLRVEAIDTPAPARAPRKKS